MTQHAHDGRGLHNHGIRRAPRIAKADRIRAVVGARRDWASSHVLEVGTGAGWMPHHWGLTAASVTSVDVADQRRVMEGYRFKEVAGTKLPFGDDGFDVVISNHVVEHVGNHDQQRHHIRELARVVRPDGLVYVACPNRWRLMEPHYRLPLLSWLPQRWADRYLQATGRGQWYDVVPASHSELVSLFAEAGLQAEEITFEIPRLMREYEKQPAPARMLASLPPALLQFGAPVVPTFVFLAVPRT